MKTTMLPPFFKIDVSLERHRNITLKARTLGLKISFEILNIGRQCGFKAMFFCKCHKPPLQLMDIENKIRRFVVNG
jgi:hypothetical protein